MWRALLPQPEAESSGSLGQLRRRLGPVFSSQKERKEGEDMVQKGDKSKIEGTVPTFVRRAKSVKGAKVPPGALKEAKPESSAFCCARETRRQTNARKRTASTVGLS